MKDKYRVVFYLTDTQYAKMEERAKNCGMSVNAFAKQLALDDTDCVKLKRGTASTMAKLYAWSEQTADLTARAFMKEAADLLWQSLK